MNKKFILIILVLILIIGFAIFILLNLSEKKEAKFSWENWTLIKSGQECLSYGGNWHIWSYWQGQEKACDMPYPDGGKICADSSDCESGKCLFMGENPQINTSAKGECTKWISDSCPPLAYYVRNGKIVKEECIE